jgi:hypothetical protein
MPEYQIAFDDSTSPNGWHVVETFEAENDKAANAYADANYFDEEWWVLDAHGRNINGGHDQDD